MLWRRWRQGESLRAIARALDRRRKVVHRILVGTGGFTPVPRRRSPRYRLNSRAKPGSPKKPGFRGTHPGRSV